MDVKQYSFDQKPPKTSAIKTANTSKLENAQFSFTSWITLILDGFKLTRNQEIISCQETKVLLPFVAIANLFFIETGLSGRAI